MDSAYIEMALPNCPLEVGECNNGGESISSLTAFSNSPPLMHNLEPSLDVVDIKLEPDLNEDMPPPNTIPGLAQFTTVEFSGFAGESFSGSVVSSAGELSEGQGSSTSAPVLTASQSVLQTPQQESSSQYVQQQSHVPDHRLGSVSASPGPSCGSSGDSPAPSTSLSHPSVGSPWSLDASCLPNSDNPAATSSLPSATTTTTSVGTMFALPTQSTDTPKLEKPQPPKKPLTPYMRFSKAIWQQVKAAHPSLSVCEVGAAIGKMWREMVETEKQRYNEDFVIDKVRYDDELQSYLKMTGLQASDLSKPKAKKKDARDKPQTPLRPTKLQVMSFVTTEQTSVTVAAAGERTAEPLATTAAVPGGMNGAALRATGGFQTVVGGGGGGGGGEDCSSLGTNLSTLPHFSQVWSGQEVYANQQLLAQMGFTPGQTIFTNQTMGEATNTSGLITIQSQDVNQNEGPQVTALYSGQSQSLQNVGNQGVASHVQMSVGQIDNNNVMTSSDNAWLWQQYNTGNQFLQDAMTQSSLPQNHEGVIIYQLTSDGAHSSLVQPSMETDLHANQNLSGVVLAKPSSVAATNGTVEAVLEPGEVPLSGQTAVSNGPIEPGVYDLNQLCGLMPWNQTKDEKLRGFVQPVDGEKQLLRSALLEKSKEIQRLTRELELAYGLIHQLKQQNDLFQRHWNGQQQMQQQQQLHQQQQQQLQQQQQQQLQQQLYIIPKTESATSLSVST